MAQSNINVNMPAPLRPTTASVRQNFTVAKAEIEALMGSVGGPGSPGPPGPAGQAATISVLNTNTTAPGTDASVVQGGTPQVRTLIFNIPRGAQGEQGPPGIPGSGSGTAATQLYVYQALNVLRSEIEAQYVRIAGVVPIAPPAPPAGGDATEQYVIDSIQALRTEVAAQYVRIG